VSDLEDDRDDQVLLVGRQRWKGVIIREGRQSSSSRGAARGLSIRCRGLRGVKRVWWCGNHGERGTN